MATASRHFWRDDSHERSVEEMYSQGVSNYTDIHQGYLNFGLWEQGVGSYLEAAENMVRRMGELLHLAPGARLLDVACGTGTQDLYLFRRFGPLEIDALDVTWPHVRLAADRARREGLAPHIRFHHGTATHLPFPGSSFSHVLCIEGAEHFDTREAFLRDAYRVLAPGGSIALADYVLKREPRSRIEEGVLDATLRFWKIPRANVCTTRGYWHLLESCGFAPGSIEEVGALTFPGYFREQSRPGFRLHKIRTQGVRIGGVGFVIDIAAYLAFRLGLVEYVLVHARKPSGAATD